MREEPIANSQQPTANSQEPRANRQPMSNTRERVFTFVKENILSGVPPTVREVQEALGFKSSASAREHLDRLVAEGRLVRSEGGRSRGFRLPSAAAALERALQIPILGRVQAGNWNLAVEDIEGYLWVPDLYAGKRRSVKRVGKRQATAATTAARNPADRLFALRVQGESMTGAGILPGDFAVVRRQPDAESGQIVVALVDDEATVKTLRRRGRHIELHPANPDFKVLRPDPEALVILGKVVEVRRRYEGA